MICGVISAYISTHKSSENAVPCIACEENHSNFKRTQSHVFWKETQFFSGFGGNTDSCFLWTFLSSRRTALEKFIGINI